MSLTTDVEAFYGTPVLAQLTNTVTGIDTVNTTRLAQAVTLTEALFKTCCGSVFDDTNDAHMAYAIEGVALVLALSKREAKAEKNLAEWKGRLKTELSLVGHNNRVTPVGNSNLDVTVDADWRTRPDFDAGYADALVPGGTDGATRTESPPGTDPP